MPVLYTNNAASTLAAGISSVATSLSVAASAGALFPSPSGGDVFYATLSDTAGNIEIVRVTARSTDTLTIVRAQDGTSARAWLAGDAVELRVTRAMLDDIKADVQAALRAAANTFTNNQAVSVNNASAALSLTQAGSGPAASLSGRLLMSAGALQEARVAIAASTIDLALGNWFTRTISGATTFTITNVPAAGTTAAFVLDLTNGGSATVTWWSGVKWAGGTAPTLTSSGRDVLGFFTHDGGTTWTGLLLGKDVK